MRLGLATVGFALCLCLLAAAMAGGAVAQSEGSDTQAPEFANATKENATTIELTISDDTDVDESSITRIDFALDHGTISNVAVSESGTDATVEIRLESAVAHDEVTVSIAEGAWITDEAGNRLTNASAVVTGMDEYPPQLQDVSVERVNESTARLRVVSSESLSDLYVGVGGPGAETLTIDNFTERPSSSRMTVPYEASVTFDREGEFTFVVGTLVDENGIQSRYQVKKELLVDWTPPGAVIGGPASADYGDTVVFDASASADEFGIAGYNWTVDGTPAGNASTLGHQFDTPGYHDVTLSVRDRRGNVGTTSMPVYVDAVATRENVTISGDVTALITATIGANRTHNRVLIDQTGTILVTQNLRLHSLAVDVPRNKPASLTFRPRSNVSTWYDGPATAVGGFAIEHDRPLSSATFRFSLNRSQLAEDGFTPEEVRLYRDADGWQPVYTTLVEESDRRLTYEATTAGLSRFVVAADDGAVDTEPDNTTDQSDGSTDTNTSADDSDGVDDAEPPANDSDGTNDTDGSATDGDDADDGEPATNDSEDTPASDPEPMGSARILVENSTLLTPEIDPGERALVRATLHNRGNATGDHVTGLVVNNSLVTTETVTVPPGENRSVTFAAAVSQGGTVVVNGTLAGTLTVGTNGSAATASSGGLPIPNPLALWPGGLFGRVLGAVFWFVVVLYAVLKGLAIYLGY